MTRYLVTGGAGYIGTHFVERLICEAETEIVVLDKNKLQLSRLKASLPTGTYVDYKLLSDCYRVVDTTDVVVHMAASNSVVESLSSPTEYYVDPVIAVNKMLHMATNLSAKKFVFISTGLANQRESNPYAMGKWYCEQIVRQYCNANGIKWVILRLYNVSGYASMLAPVKHGQLMVETCKAVKNGTPVCLNFLSDGNTAVRDYIHVYDVVEQILASVDDDVDITRDVGTGIGTTTCNVVNFAEEHFGISIPVKPRCSMHAGVSSSVAPLCSMKFPKLQRLYIQSMLESTMERLNHKED